MIRVDVLEVVVVRGNNKYACSHIFSFTIIVVEEGFGLATKAMLSKA